MMGRQPKVQNKLFYTAVNLEQRVRKNHILRKVKSNIDFDFIYNEVKDKYGINGNESVASPVILKMMLLLIFYNVRSERELVLTIPERLDWLWFLDYDIDDEIPNHSVLSKARVRWGVETFKTFFDGFGLRIVWIFNVDLQHHKFIPKYFLYFGFGESGFFHASAIGTPSSVVVQYYRFACSFRFR